MNRVFHLDEASRPLSGFVAIAWIIILIKCAAVWWAIHHWNVPVHPFWVIGPTLAMATLATLLWATHDAD